MSVIACADCDHTYFVTNRIKMAAAGGSSGFEELKLPELVRCIGLRHCWSVHKAESVRHVEAASDPTHHSTQIPTINVAALQVRRT